MRQAHGRMVGLQVWLGCRGRNPGWGRRERSQLAPTTIKHTIGLSPLFYLDWRKVAGV